MPNYREMYFRLFNRVSDAIEILQQAQIESENTFISNEDAPPIRLLNFQKQDEEEQQAD